MHLDHRRVDCERVAALAVGEDVLGGDAVSEMIERVARAICETEKMNPDDALGGWLHWREAAVAAINAMKNPSLGMCQVLSESCSNHCFDGCACGDVWNIGIEEALR